MVAVASPAVPTPAIRRAGLGWTGGAAAVLVIGLGLRLLLGGTGVGDRSALVMSTLLTLGAWLAARLIGGPRGAFVVSLGLMALFDIAALPRRGATEYDSVEAWYRTDQVVAAHLAVSSAGGPTTTTAAAAAATTTTTTAAAATTATTTTDNNLMMTLLVQPVFAGAQPRFGLAAEVNGASLDWACPFERAIQRLALPLPRGALGGSSSVDVRLHLTGSPTRETDYLLLYTSSQRGGPLVSLESGAPSGGTLTTCSLLS